MRAWKYLHNLREANAAKSWLFTILRRENARRFERVQPEYQPGVDINDLPAAMHFDTSTEAFVLRRALGQLDAQYREPLVLQVLGGFSSAEIAQLMNLTEATVNTRLFRARKRLREQLQGADVQHTAKL